MLASRALMKVVLRSFFLQAGWNSEQLQGVGLAWALSPGLRAIYSDGSDLDAAIRRHMGVFNTHPYMASVVLGTILKMERDRANADEAGVAAIDQMLRSFKLGVGGSYGALGDGLFWGGLKPLALAFGALVGLFLGPLAGVVAFLLFYNIGHMSMRVGGFVSGYQNGVQVVLKVRNWQLPRLTRGGRLLALCVFGVVMGFLALPPVEGSHRAVLAGGALAIAFGSHRYLRSGRSSLSLVYLACALSILVRVLLTWGQNL